MVGFSQNPDELTPSTVKGKREPDDEEEAPALDPEADPGCGGP